MPWLGIRGNGTLSHALPRKFRLGPVLYLQQQDGELLYSNRRLGTRALTTVFGTVELVRMGYSRPGVPGIFPLDRALTLPARSATGDSQTRLDSRSIPLGASHFLKASIMSSHLTGLEM